MTSDLTGEVDMSRRVDEINEVSTFICEGEGGRGGEGEQRGKRKEKREGGDITWVNTEQ